MNPERPLTDGEPPTWTADNGNGTFTNPLFYDEFSDPDMIRVGGDYYLTGTTMHAMPGLPVLHSRDLVNWTFVSYALNRLDLGPEFRLEDGEIYGQGIWAPCFRHHNGEFLIFSNVNRRNTQIFRSTNPAGPWTRSEMDVSLHDLSVLFNDDAIYAVWGYQEIRLAELTPDLRSIKPGSERTIIPRGSGVGEGCHFLKIDGRYYIFSTVYDPTLYHVCARSDSPSGPYEVMTISANEPFGIAGGYRTDPMFCEGEFKLVPPNPRSASRVGIHQGAIIDTPKGHWWGFSMMDANSVGRLTCLSPVTWQDGWPYFGLPGNPGRSPITWKKPETGHVQSPTAPFRRSDDFSGSALSPIWQWNHCPDDALWSLSERPDALRLYTLPAKSLWDARNTLTQRCVGPVSSATVAIDVSGLLPGDVAGLGLLNRPYCELGVTISEGIATIGYFDQLTQSRKSATVAQSTLWLRATCDFTNELAQMSYSTDGSHFQELGMPVRLVFQLKTFQGVRYALFAYTASGRPGGYTDFIDFQVREPLALERRTIPLGRRGVIRSLADRAILTVRNGCVSNLPTADGPEDTCIFTVIDRGAGAVALQAPGGAYVTVDGPGTACNLRVRAANLGDRQSFQWQNLGGGCFALLSLQTHRYVRCAPFDYGLISADHPGPDPGRMDGSVFEMEYADET